MILRASLVTLCSLLSVSGALAQDTEPGTGQPVEASPDEAPQDAQTSDQESDDARAADGSTTSAQEVEGSANVYTTSPDPAEAEEDPLADEIQGRAAAEAGQSGAVLGEDVEPTMAAVKTEGFELNIGGLTQVHLGYAGDDALIDNGDVASETGFRIRRARIGFSANFDYGLGVFITLNLLQADRNDGILSDAKLVWAIAPELRLSMGSGKVPFSAASLASSSRLPLIERPLSVGAIAPGRRLGVTAEGAALDGLLAYFAGVSNGTDGFRFGNQFGGFLAGARVEVRPWGNPTLRDPWQDGVKVGGGVIYEDAPAINRFAWSADVTAAMAGARLSFEVLCDTSTPDDAPDTPPSVADTIDRCGGYVEAAYTLPFYKEFMIQPVVRGELFDDDRSLDNAGDVMLIGGGVNAQLLERYIRAQLIYMARIEQHGTERSNDTLTFNLQGSF